MPLHENPTNKVGKVDNFAGGFGRKISDGKSVKPRKSAASIAKALGGAKGRTTSVKTKGGRAYGGEFTPRTF